MSEPRLGRRAFVRLLAAGALGGCGYSFHGSLPGHLRTIAVPVLRNRTSEPGVENFVTNALVEAFATNGRLRVVRAEEADSLLDGEVLGYEIQSIAFDPNANVRQYRLVLRLKLLYRDLRRNEVLYEAILSERSDFRTAGQVSQTIGREETAVRSAAVDIARAVVSRIVERF
jgi:hypothetical protein